MKSNIQKTKLSYLITIPKIQDEGFLYVAESGNHIPFSIKRIYFISDAIKNAVRGMHAHKETRQVLFCIKGSITIVLDNGEETEDIILKNAEHGIFLNSMMWHVMKKFTKETLLLVIASDVYDESDYIRSYDEFKKIVLKSKKLCNKKRLSQIDSVREELV